MLTMMALGSVFEPTPGKEMTPEEAKEYEARRKIIEAKEKQQRRARYESDVRCAVHFERNTPCPCGSGKKAKFCFGA
jgi:uncharacterized protein YecA (UPF0149 family)